MASPPFAALLAVKPPLSPGEFPVKRPHFIDPAR